MPLHVFFDNSNVWGGAQNLRARLEPTVPWQALRLYYRNLFSIVEKQRPAETKVLGGSVPPSCTELWEYAHEAGYQTNLLRRVERDDGSIGEQGVDEVLHLKIANTLLDHRPGTLAICTGDGRTSEFGTGFYHQIERALRIGWQVEVYAWEDTCSGRYFRLAERTQDISVHVLDPTYLSTTFVKGGQYFRLSPDGTREDFYIAPRVVRPVPR